MSSPATTIEKSNETQPSNTLLIIPDGSSLWLTPDSDSAGQQFGWRKDVFTSLVEQLPVCTLPILIGAKGHTADQLLNGRFDSSWKWDDYLAQQGLTIVPRFVDSTYSDNYIGSTDPDAKRIELWFIPNDTFGHVSDGWSSTLRRLGFSTPRWRAHDPLLQNLEKKRVRNVVPSPARPTSITVGTFVDRQLFTTNYEISD